MAVRAFDEHAFNQVGNSSYRIIWTVVRQHWLETGQLPALDVLLAKIGLVVENDIQIIPAMRRHGNRAHQ